MLKIIILAVLLAACSSSESQANGGYEICASAGCATLKLVSLEDGTPCAVLIGSQKSALSCDWERARK